MLDDPELAFQLHALVGGAPAYRSMCVERPDSVAGFDDGQGPHLEDLARSWCIDHAAPETLGALPSRCEPAVIACREHKKKHELDVVVSADPPGEKSRILAIGKSRRPSGSSASISWRLQHVRSLLPVDAVAGEPKLLLFSRQGYLAS